MKKILPYSVIVIILLLLVSACRKNGEPINETRLSVSLYNCYNVKNGPGVRICYDSLTNDSRCPEDAVCIWAGFATIKVSFCENGRLHRFNMLYVAGNRQHYNQFGAVSDTSVNGYQIKLIDVLPHPKVSGPVPASDQYSAVFTISR